MAKHIVNRFDFDTVMAGFFRIIENPAEYYKYKKLIEPELFFYNDISPKPLALRKLIGWFHDMMDAKKTTSPSLLTFSGYIKSYIVDSDKNAEAIQLFESMRTNPDIRAKVDADGTFDLFKDYLRILRFIKYSNLMFDEYQKGDSDKAAEYMNLTLSDLALIKSEAEIEFNADTDLEPMIFGTGKEVTTSLFLGLPAFDSHIGGFEQRTLNLFMSVTNGGKSMMSHHLISRAIEQRLHVHVTCVEDRVESFVRKIVACLTGISMGVLKSYKDSNNKPDATDKAKIIAAKALIHQYVKVDFVYGQGIDAIHKRKREYDLECIANGTPVPIVDIVDYTGHISGKSFGDKMYEQMRNAYAARKDYALTANKISFDFAQVNREGNKRMNNEEKTLTAADLAGSYDLAQVCDNIISINRNALNIETQTAVLKVAKARDGEVGHEFEVKTDFGCARFLMNHESNVWLTGRGQTVAALNPVNTTPKKVI